MTRPEHPRASCPFCGYEANEYGVLLHMEHVHPEGESPFVARDSNNSSTVSAAANGGFALDDTAGIQYAECTVDGCGEVVRGDEMEYHVELHAQEEGPEDGNAVSFNRKGGGSRPLSSAGAQATAANQTRMTQVLPQERSQNDDHVPRSRREPRDNGSRHRQRAEDASNERHSGGSHRQSSLLQWMGLISRPSSALSRRHHERGRSKAGSSSGHSSSTATPEAVNHAPGIGSTTPPLMTPAQVQEKKRLGKAELGKYAHEQTMPAWLVSHLRKGKEVRAEGVLPVLEQLLEQSATTKYAYLCHPEVEHVSKLKREGGFCGYRNIQMMVSYINAVSFPGHQHFDGLPSVFRIQDLIENAWDKGINAQGRVETGGVKGTRKYIGTPEAQAVLCSLEIPCEAQGFKNREPGRSEARLMQEVERYFQSGDFNPEYKVRRTKMPPIYFQHAGHSMTIVGFEKLKSGLTNLLVFDPMFRDSSAILKLVGRQFEYKFPDLALKPYRRGNKYLKKYREFELLKLKPPQPA
ncbi:hypothetical protein MCOR27_009683 [Pyricularia oryzae]|uniref:UFSP1/2/DUB catalytic domain-containing protein n=4 Tax=Pyricularia TaxID=48558 RepID=A0ABQ8N4F2_PYRGI|nr:uncharacterized protein MGG_06912 [Pyricularia oryzae 70-15]KAH8842209.1 hypothetical protein MCOR01_006137 [Pyricularia oryzae]KAI6291095.1 hypothetical protein MCOR33_010842 [Pyricularia grisea]EHA57034.1 hypothetical protein MGG_06912 [Pyricularia oryzae 70-15]KAI6252799.1 hypothetical protein MCOR19_010603 [Pyricularia oryzae]KAI6265908.1 hypothetical protein MCOR26_010495 [Pyricularia oryzae]